jgi:lipid II isoglutaminyl synthase (glutamine-hydrolysing)
MTATTNTPVTAHASTVFQLAPLGVAHSATTGKGGGALTRYCPQQWLAVTVAKTVAWLSKATGKGAGTSLPGRLAAKVSPHLLSSFAQQVKRYSLGVTGTNGKTTTCGLLAQILRQQNIQVIHNQLGANMVPGITTALALATNAMGELRADMAVLEVDEASLKRLTPDYPLDALVVTNLFRDQLDRYGELDTTAALILEGASQKSASQKSVEPANDALLTPLILNADDPLVAAMAKHRTHQQNTSVWRFGVDEVRFSNADTILPVTDAGVPFPGEVHQCPECGQGPLGYSAHWYGHLGHFACSDCGYKRVTPDVVATLVELSPMGSHVHLQTPKGTCQLFLPMPGLFNVYNLLAAATAALLAGAELADLQKGIDTLPGVFGRAEHRQVDGKTVRIMLIKNPVGATEVLRCVAGDPTAKLLIALNDQDADGRDVSWIWDAEFERIAGVTQITVSGLRAPDMALRLKYAGVDAAAITREPNLKLAIRHALSHCLQDTDTLYILPTYTALLELRTVWETW